MLSDRLVSSELRRAEEIAVGLPKAPGIKATRLPSDSLRFPDYHEPLDRWPFIADPLLEKIRRHGKNPPLLSDRGRTKGVPNQRMIVHTGKPFERLLQSISPLVNKKSATQLALIDENRERCSTRTH